MTTDHDDHDDSFDDRIRLASGRWIRTPQPDYDDDSADDTDQPGQDAVDPPKPPGGRWSGMPREALTPGQTFPAGSRTTLHADDTDAAARNAFRDAVQDARTRKADRRRR